MRTPKGTCARYPAKSEPRQAMRSAIENTVRKYGFSAVETPAIERASVYTEKSGDEIVDQLFLLDEDIGASQLALTPELTPTVGRMVAEGQQGLTKPIKWYTTQRFWRYEEPQQGRFREFWQTNVDIFGVGEPEAELELLSVAIDSLAELGISEEQVELRVSDRRVLDAIIDNFEPDGKKSDVMRLIDKRDKLSSEEYRTRLRDFGIEEVTEFDSLVTTDDLEVIREEIGDVVAPLEKLVSGIENSGRSEWVSVNIGTARGLDYYTGIVFEAFDATGSVGRSLLGGGRYDSLVESYGGKKMQAAGFAFGYATLVEALEAYSISVEDTSLDTYVVRFDETADEARRVRDSLRSSGYRVDGALSGRSIGAQFGVADERGATFAVIPGPDEVSDGVVTVQRMSDGSEVSVSLEKMTSGDVRLNELQFD